DYTDQRLVQRYNADLANTLGNLLNRSLTMAHKYRAGRLARTTLPCGPAPAEHIRAYTAAMDEFRIHAALESALELAVACNQFIDAKKPWLLAKDVGQGPRLDGVLYYLAESLRIIAVLIAPVLPNTAAGIFAQLHWTGSLALEEANWGGLPDGHVVGEPTPLCPRIETAGE
ncbi:MAG: class I tRNA ligase family protein, partial [Verrucomicrobiota bacterium]|nr:class I tRNA ligase family protein [Verrucomicrobiota bacterium]